MTRTMIALLALLAGLSGCAARAVRADLSVCEATKDVMGAVASMSAEALETTLAVAELEGVARELALKQLAEQQQLIEQLQASFETGDLEVDTRDGQMVLRLPGELLYPVGETELTGEGEAVLDRLAAVLAAHPRQRFMVAGHTDDLPVGASTRYRSNRELSVLRALSAVDYLERAGVDPAQLIAAGFGEHQPQRANATEGGRAANRRLEIVLLPQIFGDGAPSEPVAAR